MYQMLLKDVILYYRSMYRGIDMETIHWRNMISTCNMKMYVHIFLFTVLYEKESVRRSTRKGQIQHKTSGAQKKKAKNELTMKTKQDH